MNTCLARGRAVRCWSRRMPRERRSSCISPLTAFPEPDLSPASPKSDPCTSRASSARNRTAPSPEGERAQGAGRVYPDDVKRTSDTTERTSPERVQRRFWTTSQRISEQFLDGGTGGGVVFCSGMAPQLRIAWRSFINLCGLGTLMPAEEPESPEEVHSQRRRSLPNVDE